jgi:hypothetical protein
LVIDRDGRVRLVTRLVVKDRPDGRAIAEFVPPVIARQGDDRTAISPRPFVFLRTSTSVEHNSEEETPPAVEHLPED